MKFKPKSYGFTFSFNPLALSPGNWLNPYFGISVPTSYQALSTDSTLTVGTVLHNSKQGSDLKTVTNQQVVIKRKDGAYRFDITNNSAMTWRNFVLSVINRVNMVADENIKKSSEYCLAYQYRELLGNVSFSGKGPQYNLGVALKYQKDKNLAFAVQRNHLFDTNNKEGLVADSSVDVGFTTEYCSGFQTKAVLRNWRTFAFWTSLTPQSRAWTTSLCYERDVKGSDFTWGTKLTFNL